MKKGFTLAEVLITLGIIGVVAAMTMPTLINNQKNAALQSQFKKAYSNCANALTNWKTETGMIGLYRMFATYNGTEYVNSGTFTTQYMQQMKSIGSTTYTTPPKNFNRTRNMNLESRTCTPNTLLPDGSAICAFIYSGTISVTVDINGTRKNPNAWGHDIFTFVVDPNTEQLVGMRPSGAAPNPDSPYPEGDGLPCSRNVATAGNGLGCAYFAIINQCPDDDSKTYWECIP